MRFDPENEVQRLSQKKPREASEKMSQVLAAGINELGRQNKGRSCSKYCQDLGRRVVNARSAVRNEKK